MDQTIRDSKVPKWALVLRFIPLLVTLAVVVLLLVYRPEGYGTVLFGFIAAYSFGACLWLFAQRRLRKRNQKNG